MLSRSTMWFVLCGLISGCEDTYIKSGYGSWSGFGEGMGPRSWDRPGPHSGVDFRGGDGDPVLAADDGVVAGQMSAPSGIGTCVLLEHHCFGCEPFLFYTSYCHLQRSLVTSGQPVLRGQQIAVLGHSGRFSGGIPHVHFSMCQFPCLAGAKIERTFDPMKYDVGCFDPKRTYKPAKTPILTHPIVCP